MKLNELRDNPGATKSIRRIGRGIGSGRGKTGGRGGKGQTARTGVRIKGFEGGQMPLHRRLPKRGFNRPFRWNYVGVNLGQIQAALDSGKLKKDGAINAKTLRESGVISHARDGIRLLGKGSLSQAITLEVMGASASAKAAVEKAGGKLTILVTPKPAPANSFEARRAKAKETAAKAKAARTEAKPKAKDAGAEKKPKAPKPEAGAAE